MTSDSTILKAFPFLQGPELEEEIIQHSTIMPAGPGDVLIREGQYLKVLPLVISGSLRVTQQSAEREILLYHVLPGETCIMSLSSCFFNRKSPSRAIVDTPSEILCVPANFIKEWQRKYDQWNEFVINTFQGRYNELLNLFNSVVFNNMETRIADYLNNHPSRQGTRRYLRTLNILIPSVYGPSADEDPFA